MRRYRYTAVDRDGVRQTGEVDAASPEAAQRLLSERGWLVSRVDDITSESPALAETEFQAIKPVAQPLMAVMSLRALSEELTHPGQRRAINDLATALQNGVDVSAAVNVVRSALPQRLTQLIQLGLKYNRLDWFVAHYLESTRRTTESRHRLISALGYPAVTG
ncbi:MAG TPA: type II secretion system F family protein, partial [Planctomycetaceae bacterium]|nr:type II secretion system F family protein [Planctomycetaceae bacterium]